MREKNLNKILNIFGATTAIWTIFWFFFMILSKNLNTIKGLILFIWGFIFLGIYIIFKIIILIIKIIKNKIK